MDKIQFSKSPISRSTTSFNSHKLKLGDANLIKLVPSLQNILFRSVFLFMPAGALIGTYFSSGQVSYLFSLFTTPFTLFGLMLSWYTSGFEFNRQSREIHVYSLNKKRRAHPLVTFDQVVALQLINSSTDSYSTVELNLCFKNGERYNLLCHAIKKKIYQQAEEISKFIGVPVWEPESEDQE